MSYKLSGVLVRAYGGKMYLSVTKKDFKISPIEDIGEVYEGSEKLVQERKRML